MHLNIEHSTHYTYPNAVDYTIRQLRLTPQDGFGQRVKSWAIRVNGRAQPYADTFGNLSHTLVLDTPHSEISITAYGEVETGLDTPSPVDPLPLPVYLRATALTTMEGPLTEFVQYFGKPGGSLGKVELYALMRAVRDRVVPRESGSEGPGTAAEAFVAGIGTSHDHAHIFIACCRYLGAPARYVSGYLFSDDGSLIQSHAWADVYLDDSWLSFDVYNNCRTNGTHIRLAVGLDYRGACPVNGIRSGSSSETINTIVLANSLQPTQLQQQVQQ